MTDLDALVQSRNEWLRVLRMDDDVVRADAEGRLSTCRTALEIVDARLSAIGYPVHPIVRPLEAGGLAQVRAALQEAELEIPPLLSLAWEVIGEVSVLDFDGYRHVSFWDQRLGRNDACTDGLHIDAPGGGDSDYESFSDHVIDEHEGWLDSGLDEEAFEFPVAPDDLHKDNVSGGDPYGLVHGPSTWDNRLANFSWRGSPVTAPEGAPDLLSYLRTAILECGCFPGLFGLDEFETDRQYLTADLPIF